MDSFYLHLHLYLLLLLLVDFLLLLRILGKHIFVYFLVASYWFLLRVILWYIFLLRFFLLLALLLRLLKQLLLLLFFLLLFHKVFTLLFQLVQLLYINRFNWLELANHILVLLFVKLGNQIGNNFLSFFESLKRHREILSVVLAHVVVSSSSEKMVLSESPLNSDIIYILQYFYSEIEVGEALFEFSFVIQALGHKVVTIREFYL